MKTPKNIKEFKKLIEKYESIPLEKIQMVWNKVFGKNGSDGYSSAGHIVAQKLTGFGGNATCILCKKVVNECYDCVYGKPYGCLSRPHRSTYFSIAYAQTPKQLYNAFQRRAKHLREHFKDILN